MDKQEDQPIQDNNQQPDFQEFDVDDTNFGHEIFKEIYTPAYKISRKGDRLARIEANFITKIAKQFKISGSVLDEMILETKNRIDKNRLTFNSFIDRFSDFPVFLCPAFISYVQEEKLFNLASTKRFKKCQIYKTWLKIFDRVPANWICENRPVGVVFEVYNVGTPGLLWIFHNYNFISDFTLMISCNSEVFHLQPFNQFIGALRWNP